MTLKRYYNMGGIPRSLCQILFIFGMEHLITVLKQTTNLQNPTSIVWRDIADRKWHIRYVVLATSPKHQPRPREETANNRPNWCKSNVLWHRLRHPVCTSLVKRQKLIESDKSAVYGTRFDPGPAKILTVSTCSSCSNLWVATSNEAKMSRSVPAHLQHIIYPELRGYLP